MFFFLIFSLTTKLYLVLSIKNGSPVASSSDELLTPFPLSDYHMYKQAFADPYYPRDPYDIMMQVS